MSNFWKIGLPVIVIVIIIIAGVWYSSSPSGSNAINEYRTSANTASTSTISKTDSSDSALNNDLGQIDTELNASAQESSAINVNQ